MNRTERLYAVAEHLRRSGTAGVRAADLASYLEVSTRTIKRDISALQQSGLPIWGQTGPSGGYFLADTATLPPVNFSVSQAVAVSVALAVMPSGSPFGADGQTAARKIGDALGPQEQERVAGLSARVWVDTPGAQMPVVAAKVLRAVEQSLVMRRAVSIVHRDAADDAADGQTRSPVRRIVEPTILAWTDSRWYLVAYCRERGAIGWFRLDHIDAATLTTVGYVPRPVAEIGRPPATARPVDL